MGDANAANFPYPTPSLALPRAPALRAAFFTDGIERRYQGIPGSTRSPPTRRARPTTRTSAPVPHVSNAKASACNTALGTQTLSLLGIPILDGSRAACDWDNDPDAVAPGSWALPSPEPVPRRLRHELQRLLLAVEPRASARGVRADHRRRAHHAIAAHPTGAEDGGGPEVLARGPTDTVFNDRQYGDDCSPASWPPTAAPTPR